MYVWLKMIYLKISLVIPTENGNVRVVTNVYGVQSFQQLIKHNVFQESSCIPVHVCYARFSFRRRKKIVYLIL